MKYLIKNQDGVVFRESKEGQTSITETCSGKHQLWDPVFYAMKIGHYSSHYFDEIARMEVDFWSPPNHMH